MIDTLSYYLKCLSFLDEQFGANYVMLTLTGDQGFLNSYFPDFANARIFDPHASAEELKSRPIPQMERLSTLYNADVGLYMLANKVTSLISLSGYIVLLIFVLFVLIT